MTDPNTPNKVPDQLYDFYLHLNETIPDIIGKQEHEMTKSQKTRFHAKLKEIQDDGLTQAGRNIYKKPFYKDKPYKK